MKFSLSARMLQPDYQDMPVEEFVALAKRAGFDGVELRPWQWQEKKLDGLSKGDVLVVFAHPDALGQSFKVAAQVEAPLVRAHLPSDQLASLLPYAQSDVRFGPQLHTGGEYETIEQTAAALSGITDPRIGIILEPANLHLVGDDVTAEALEPLRGRIVGCNLQSLTVGQGTDQLKLSDGRTVNYQRSAVGDWSPVRLPTFLGSLKTLGFDGVLNVIEPLHQDIPLEEQARQWNQSLRAALEEAGG